MKQVPVAATYKFCRTFNVWFQYSFEKRWNKYKVYTCMYIHSWKKNPIASELRIFSSQHFKDDSKNY